MSTINGGQLQSGSILGEYRIDELISRGGMGVVYRARHMALNRVYALKVLAPELAADEQFRDRFRREIRIAASLHHPNIVEIHYAGEHEGLLFFVMDYITGTDLHEVLRKHGALEPSRTVDLLGQLASALDAAHGRGLVHRDVKPGNVLITVHRGEECAYLTDFGLARKYATASALSSKGLLVGTVDYMAPEQINGDRVDARADIYALGCVFYHMLTGSVPYERDNSVATLVAHVHDPPPLLHGDVADTHPEFEAVVKKAMAKDPGSRYFSAGDFAADAEAALSGQRHTAPPTILGIGEAEPLSPAAETGRRAAPETMVSGPTGEGLAETHISGDEVVSPAKHAGSEPGPPATIGRAPGTTSSPDGPRSPLKRYRLPALGALVLLVVAVVAVILITSGGSSRPASERGAGGQHFLATAQPVPTNHVNATGSAAVVLNGNEVTVTLHTSGLLDGSPHLMHIHAGGLGECPPASAARLHNRHPAIDTNDGLRWYGPPQASLTVTGDTSATSLQHSILAFPRYPSVGNIGYKRTFEVPSGIAASIRHDDAVIVVHGIDYDHSGSYNDVLGQSQLNPGIPSEATAPALCGPLRGTAAASIHGQGGPRSAVFVATLRRPVASAVTHDRSSSYSLLCHVLGLPTPATPEEVTRIRVT